MGLLNLGKIGGKSKPEDHKQQINKRIEQQKAKYAQKFTAQPKLEDLDVEKPKKKKKTKQGQQVAVTKSQMALERRQQQIVTTSQQVAARQQQQVTPQQKQQVVPQQKQQVVTKQQVQQQATRQQHTEPQQTQSIIDDVVVVQKQTAQQYLAKQKQQVERVIKEESNLLVKVLKAKATKKISVEEYIKTQEEAIGNAENLIERFRAKAESIENYLATNDVTKNSTKNKLNDVYNKYIRETLNLEKLIDEKKSIIQGLTLSSKSEEITVKDVKETIETLEEASDVDLTGVDQEKLVVETEVALDSIPDVANISLDNIKIKKSDKTDKTGYFKVKVTIKANNMPDIVNSIASYVKQHTNGLIKPRVVDMRVIGNTNRTQLRNQKLKLTSRTVVFKPDFNRMKVNKSTRIMISVPEDYSEANPKLLVYMQESRAKTIIPVSSEGFESLNHFIEFIGDRIVSYYRYGFEASLQRLQLRNEHSPLMDISTMILRTGDYKLRIQRVREVLGADAGTVSEDELNDIARIIVRTKNIKNEWLNVSIYQSDNGLYTIEGFNEVTKDTYQLIDESVKTTYDWMRTNIIQLLYNAYNRDWTDVMYSDGTSKFAYMLKKLTHRKLRLATQMIHDTLESHKTLMGQIVKTISKNEMARALDKEYDAEAVHGETTTLDYFLLTYYAPRIEGGDARFGGDYISTQHYYQKYGVGDRSQYVDRKRTIPRYEGANRNYHARKYMFRLQYKIDGVPGEHSCFGMTINDILEATGILTEHPIANPVSTVENVVWKQQQ